MKKIGYAWYQDKLQFADTEENIRYLYLDLNVSMALTAKLIDRPIADLSKYIWNHGLAEAKNKKLLHEGAKEICRISELRKILQEQETDHSDNDSERSVSLEEQFLKELGL